MQNGDGEKVIEIPTWGIGLFAATIIGFAIFYTMLFYTLEEVVGTLTMVETPMSSIRLGDEAANPLNKSVDPNEAVPAAESKPVAITGKIRSTIRHVVSQGGPRARWRGFRMYLVYMVLSGIVNGFFAYLVPVPGLSVLITVMILAPVHAGWTHAVVAAPSTQKKSMWSRILPRSSYKQLLAPSAAMGVANIILAYVSLGLRMLATPQEDPAFAEVVSKPLVFLCVYILVALFIVLPAAVALARVETSLLPEDEDTIVPVDRTFNGKVVAKEYGGTGALGFIDAWKSFDWEARRRLLKLYVKILMIGLALGLAIGLILIFEGTLVLGQSEFKNAACKGLESIRDLKM